RCHRRDTGGIEGTACVAAAWRQSGDRRRPDPGMRWRAVRQAGRCRGGAQPAADVARSQPSPDQRRRADARRPASLAPCRWRRPEDARLQPEFSRLLSGLGRSGGTVVGRCLSAGGYRRAAVCRHRRRLLHDSGSAAPAAAGYPAGAWSPADVSNVQAPALSGPTLSGRSRIVGVMGWPVSHSRSPRLHGYWLRTYGIDGAYIPLPVKAEQFTAALRALPLLGFAGANVTVPHKEAALKVVDRSDSAARRIGAVNTIVVAPDGTLDGSNSDGFGFMENLHAGAPAWSPQAGPAVI